MQERIETLEQQPNESEVEARCDKYEFPESTYTLLMTENLVSIPFATGIIAAAFCMMCLVLAFMNELENGEAGNRLGKCDRCEI